MKDLWRNFWFQAVTLFLLAFSVFTSIQTLNSNIMDVDGYYHIRLAQMMHSGWILDRLPQAKLTFFHEHFADTEFIFHVLLMPFAQHDLNQGAKLAVIVLDTIFVLTCFAVLRSCGVSWAIFVFLGFAALSQRFWYQLIPPRAHLLSMSIVVASIWAMEQERKKTLAVLSLLEALSYTAWHFIPGLSLIYAVQERIRLGKYKGSIFGFSLGGALLGILMHPHPLTHAYVWYLQNIVFFFHRFFPTVDIPRGSEWAPVSILRMAQLFYFEFFLMAVTLFLKFYLKKPWRIWGTLGIVFFLMTKSSMKFCHYWSPVCLIAAMIFLADCWKSRKKVAQILASVLVVFSLFLAFKNQRLLRNLANFGPGYRAEDRLGIEQHVPQGAYLYNCNWLSSPELFFHRPDLTVPILLDPIFAYYGDRDGFMDWQDLCSGHAQKLMSLTLQKAHADFIILSQLTAILVQQAAQDQGLSLAWQNDRYALFQVQGPNKSK